MTGPLSEYAFINAKLRARISKILPDDLWHQLAKAPSLDAALALLRETPFAGLEQDYATTGDLKHTELQLLGYEIDLYRDVRRYLHTNSQRLVDALLTQYEIDNLKNAIRVYFDRKTRKRSVDTHIHYVLLEPIIHDIPIDTILNADSFDEIISGLDKTPYGRIVSRYGPAIQSEGSLFRLEIALDHFYYENLLAGIEKLSPRDRKIALRLTGVEIDLQNISWIIRLKQYHDLPLETVLTTLIPGGFTLKRDRIDDLYHAQNVASVLGGFINDQYPGLSTLLANPTADSTSRLNLIRRILEEIKKLEIRHILMGYPFTVGIILAYFGLKRDEHTKIRMLLNAKLYGRSEEWIESML